MTGNLKLAFKVLGRRKFFTFISLFGTSLTLVVLMVAAAILDNFFAPRAPESRFDRVLCVYKVKLFGEHDTWSSEPGFGFLDRYVKPIHDVAETAIFSNAQQTAIYLGDQKLETIIKRTDAGYWKILDFHFLEGRPFTRAEDDSGAPVAVITDQLRDRLFGDVSALGRTVEIEGRGYRVIGVVPRISLTRVAAFSDMWMPIGTMPSSAFRHEMMGGFNGLVLAHSRSDFPRLKREFQTSLRNFPFDDPKVMNHIRAGLDTPFEAFARNISSNRLDQNPVLIVEAAFFIIAVLFMTLPALNLITLSLSRILERSSEIGVRKAFGAPRRSLMAQFIVENVVLTLLGGAAGFVLSAFVLAMLGRYDVIPNARFDLNLRIFLEATVIALFFGVFSGTYPAWRMSRLDPVNALRGGEL